jgi:hypothetical protein
MLNERNGWKDDAAHDRERGPSVDSCFGSGASTACYEFDTLCAALNPAFS